MDEHNEHQDSVVDEILILKATSTSNVPKLATAVYGAFLKCFKERKYKGVQVRAIGAPAVNQAVKAITAAKGRLAANGFDLAISPGFDTTQVEGEDKTVIKLKLLNV